jgi:hypothetical protein
MFQWGWNWPWLLPKGRSLLHTQIVFPWHYFAMCSGTQQLQRTYGHHGRPTSQQWKAQFIKTVLALSLYRREKLQIASGTSLRLNCRVSLQKEDVYICLRAYGCHCQPLFSLTKHKKYICINVEWLSIYSSSTTGAQGFSAHLHNSILKAEGHMTG